MNRSEQLNALRADVDALARADEATVLAALPQWDSLAHLRLVMAVEEEFGISIPAEQVMDMVSFKIATLMVEELAA